MTTFNPNDYQKFEYLSYDLNYSTGELLLRYRISGKATPIDFTETLHFPISQYNDGNNQVVDALARLVFLAAGISYYKVAAPRFIHIFTPITAEERDFLIELYRNGLTEFAYVNNLPQSLNPQLKVDHLITPNPQALQHIENLQPLVPVGGGKDSIVTIEALRSSGFAPTLFSVNSYAPIERTVERSHLPHIIVRRALSAELIYINETGALNGHVPVTVLNSLIALLAAVLSGYKVVVFSNERSASEGNTVWQGIEVNHQWSKGIVFEKQLQYLLKQVVSPDLQYFSLLRPFSELRIARQFAKLTQYHDVFTSCNHAFYLDPDKRRNWCGHCDKCRFVFLMLAPYLSRQNLVKIWDKDLLADGAQLGGFRELLGISGHKPLECVGEIEESRLALMLLSQSDEWKEEPMVKTLLSDLPVDALPTSHQQQEVFATGEHMVPSKFYAALAEIK